MAFRLGIQFICAVTLGVMLSSDAAGETLPAASPATFLQALLQSPQADLDFAEAKLAIDAFVDPSIDSEAATAEIDRMAMVVEKMIATLPEAEATSLERMKALRAFLYEPGWWNDHQPFRYDLEDPLGQKIGAQSLTNYLKTRKGNCISMPMLFLALGESIGLDLTLSTAPLHVFVKWTEAETGKIWNLETTSGGGFTRDEHYRKLLPMTDEAIGNGVYLKTLSRKEALGVMASAVLDDLLRRGRYEDAVVVADVLIAANPADTYALVKKGTAYYRLLERDFIRKYPKESDIPADQIAYANELYRANRDAFVRAEALGWREPKLD